ncbi:Lipid A core-O-antigen ligase and related enzymes [uncultured Clostridium sp.]|nr:Lipid A core-O-antigen ligase and related enzymes [uncultured Clostridium sp.]
MKSILYFAIGVSFFGAQVFTINLGFFQLSLYRIAVLALLFLYVVNSARMEKGHYKLDEHAPNRYSVYMMVTWLIYAVLNIFWMRDLGNYARNLYFLGSGIFGVVMCSKLLRTRQDIRKALNIVNLGILLQGLIGWYEVIFRTYRFISQQNIDYYSAVTDRIPIAMQGNPNDFATLMLVGFFIAIICRTLTERKYRVFYTLCMVNCAVLLILTQSRANIIGFILGLGVLIVLSKKVRWLLPLGLVSLVYFVPDITQSMRELLHFNFTSGYGSDVVRLNLIKNGFIFLTQTFGLGVGAGQIESWMATQAMYYTKGIVNMHNWWMEILTAYGIGIFMGYLIFYGKYIRDMWRRMHQGINKDYRMAVAMIAVFAGFAIGAVSSSSNITAEWLWMFFGVAIAYQGLPVKIQRNEGGNA